MDICGNRLVLMVSCSGIAPSGHLCRALPCAFKKSFLSPFSHKYDVVLAPKVDWAVSIYEVQLFLTKAGGKGSSPHAGKSRLLAVLS